jgi:hypothetical protein
MPFLVYIYEQRTAERLWTHQSEQAAEDLGPKSSLINNPISELGYDRLENLLHLGRLSVA